MYAVYWKFIRFIDFVHYVHLLLLVSWADLFLDASGTIFINEITRWPQDDSRQLDSMKDIDNKHVSIIDKLHAHTKAFFVVGAILFWICINFHCGQAWPRVSVGRISGSKRSTKVSFWQGAAPLRDVEPNSSTHVQSSAKVGAPGLVNFITTAVAYHIGPSLPAGFTQPGASTLADLCRI